MKKIFILITTLLYCRCSFLTVTNSIQNIALEKRIGHKIKSMIVVGFRDEDLDYILKQNKAGGVILFTEDLLTAKPRNTYSKQILSKNMKKLKDANIKFIAIDQEGGKALDSKGNVLDLKYRAVNRLYFIDDFNNMPFPGDLHKKSEMNKMQYYLNKMKNLGFTVNFSPTVDIAINKDPDFFLNRKKRILADNTSSVTKIAEEIINKHHKSGLLTAIKHFPGHGSARSDTHEGFVDVTNFWKEIELEPYKKLIAKDKVDMIMTSHLFNSNLDKNYPASLSYEVITKLLREKLKYNRVVITDAIDMNALQSKYTLEEIVIKAINAGNDIILHANQMQYDKDIAKKIYTIILDNVANGKIKEESINQSYNRINNILNKKNDTKLQPSNIF
jgi:beta-N-acetylhexosaminidase